MRNTSENEKITFGRGWFRVNYRDLFSLIIFKLPRFEDNIRRRENNRAELQAGELMKESVKSFVSCLRSFLLNAVTIMCLLKENT